MIRLVITGSECTGKTTLARALAKHYDAAWVPEYARGFVLDKGAAPNKADVEAIAAGQIHSEDEAAAADPRLLVLDTDLISTVVYARHYYGHCPDWICEAALRRRGDLYLLADIDVPWVADGLTRDRGDLRGLLQAAFRAALEEFEASVLEVSGPVERRMATGTAVVDTLLCTA